MLVVAPDFAQGVAAAQLSGTVVDQSGGTLPGVEVTVTHTGTGASRFQITDTNGNYTFPSLPIGPYKLTAQLQGFSQFEQTGIVLNVGDSRSANPSQRVPSAGPNESGGGAVASRRSPCWR